MKRLAAALLLLAGGCEQQAASPPPSPGNRLEQAAVAAGLVADPVRAPLEGSWARDTDRLCVVPAGTETRIGVLVDYGEGQGCAASGVVERDGIALHIRFGACRFDANFDGDRIVFPAEMPAGCQQLCSGRATLASVEVERLSGSVSEAATLRTPGGRPLCTP